MYDKDCVPSSCPYSAVAIGTYIYICVYVHCDMYVYMCTYLYMCVCTMKIEHRALSSILLLLLVCVCICMYPCQYI